jgi:hypothetical protein
MTETDIKLWLIYARYGVCETGTPLGVVCTSQLYLCGDVGFQLLGRLDEDGGHPAQIGSTQH